MDYIHILVEGPTEVAFIDEILTKYFQPDLFLVPILVETRRTIGQLAAKKGGMPKFSKVDKQLRDLLSNSSLKLVTTMFDLYELPSDYPGMDDQKARTGTCYQQAKYLEQALAQHINHQRFLPYYSIHEIEALLFTQPTAILDAVGRTDTNAEKQLQTIRDNVRSPEEINHDEPPAKRIEKIVPTYSKTLNIAAAAQSIGVDAMREACPHFDEWLQTIEAL